MQRKELEAPFKQHALKLRKVFPKNDPAEEAQLYEQRHEILLSLRTLHPKPIEPPTIYRGQIESIHDNGIMIRTRPNHNISMCL